MGTDYKSALSEKGGFDAETSVGDGGLMFQIGEFIGDSIIFNMMVIDMLTPSTPFTGENEAYTKAGTTAPVIEKASETIIKQRYDYTTTDPLRGNASQVHAGYPRDTVVKTADVSTVARLNTRDSVKQAGISAQKNAKYNKTRY